MKIIVLFCLVAVAAADKYAKIANYQYAIEEDGSFTSKYKTTNGIDVQEDGISYPGNVPESGNYVMSGSYSYPSDDGLTYTVTWTADENGFHPVGAHLPDYSHTREHIGEISDHL